MSIVFGRNLKQLRIRKNLLQSELAEDFSVAKNTISAWESGTREPSMDIICQLATYFNVTTDYLLGMDIKSNNETITTRTAVLGKGVKDHEVNKAEYLEALKQLEESREKDLARIEEIRKKLQGE